MKSEVITTQAAMRGRIDALVCGELAEDERREVLKWLEADATRWRDCALAFLEMQAWEATLGERDHGPALRTQGTADKIQKLGDQLPGQPVPRGYPASRWLMPLVALAASMAAFGCGMWWRGVQVPPQQAGDVTVDRVRQAPEQASPANELLLASVPVKRGALGNVEAVLQFPVLPPEKATGTTPSSVPERVRREWERRGYKLTEERRFLPATLPDGRQVMVPVNEVKMKFVGRPVS